MVSTPFSLIFLWLMSHKIMMHIFLIRIYFNAHKKVWVIIDMTHEAWKMTKNGAKAKFSNLPFSGSSANKWPWSPLETITFWRFKLQLHNTVLSKDHQGHLLELEYHKVENVFLTFSRFFDNFLEGSRTTVINLYLCWVE